MAVAEDPAEIVTAEPVAGGGRRPTGAQLAMSIAGLSLAGLSLAALAARDGSVGWQVARGAALVLATAGALFVHARLGARGAGRLSVAVGIAAIPVGAGFTPFVVEEGPSVEAVAALGALVAGLVLAATGVVLGTRGRRLARRAGTGVATLVLAVLVAVVVGPAVLATNLPRPGIGSTPASRGLGYETATVTTADGVDLAAWYVASTNRAAVVLLHGAGSTRSNVLDEAAVLARNGFGVLMLDARGHGDSEGRAMDFGWHGDADVAAGTAYLAARPDVDRDRIGVVGSSMGGEEAIGASGSNALIRAVVAEGVTARVAADEAWLSDEFGIRGAFQERLEQLQDLVTDALTSASVPTSLRAAVEASGATRYLLITAGDVVEEGHAAAYVSAGAPDRVTTWTVAGAGHTGGLDTAPEEWESRVVRFLDDALGGSSRGVAG